VFQFIQNQARMGVKGATSNIYSSTW